MKRLLILALAAVGSTGRSGATNVGSEAQAQKPVKLEPMTVTASGLDLSPDPLVDYVLPRQQLVFEYLGHEVPGDAIMQAKGLRDLKENWRPTYASLDQFASSLSREGWRVAAKRDLKDFYVVVFATPRGNVAGEYYAKTAKGRKLQWAGKIQLFVSDSSLNQIVPNADVFTLDERIRYAVYTNANIQGLMPGIFGDGQSFISTAGANFGGTYRGWLVFHHGDLFIMPPGVKHFLFVFKGGPAAGDSMELAFTQWSRS